MTRYARNTHQTTRNPHITRYARNVRITRIAQANLLQNRFQAGPQVLRRLLGPSFRQCL